MRSPQHGSRPANNSCFGTGARRKTLDLVAATSANHSTVLQPESMVETRSTSNTHIRKVSMPATNNPTNLFRSSQHLLTSSDHVRDLAVELAEQNRRMIKKLREAFELEYDDSANPPKAKSQLGVAPLSPPEAPPAQGANEAGSPQLVRRGAYGYINLGRLVGERPDYAIKSTFSHVVPVKSALETYAKASAVAAAAGAKERVSTPTASALLPPGNPASINQIKQ